MPVLYTTNVQYLFLLFIQLLFFKIVFWLSYLKPTSLIATVFWLCLLIIRHPGGIQSNAVFLQHVVTSSTERSERKPFVPGKLEQVEQQKQAGITPSQIHCEGTLGRGLADLRADLPSGGRRCPTAPGFGAKQSQKQWGRNNYSSKSHTAV